MVVREAGSPTRLAHPRWMTTRGPTFRDIRMSDRMGTGVTKDVTSSSMPS